ncbi:UNVERIFIED_CONTAM: hypothetical protein HDU68_007395 [Siphonaria sp. JEL0065]|nr:hypothetical protein HDU68_007395 [Siphonaria sp. JEL0065]
MQFLRLVRFASTTAAAAAPTVAESARPDKLVQLRNAIVEGRSVTAETVLKSVSDNELAGLSSELGQRLVVLVGSNRTGSMTSVSRLRKLQSVVDRLATANVSVDPTEPLIKALCEAGNASAAVALASKHSLVNAPVLVSGLARAGLVDRVVSKIDSPKNFAAFSALAKYDPELADTLRVQAKDNSDQAVGAVAYAFASRGNLSRATKSVNEATEKGIHCYNALIKAYTEMLLPGDADNTYRDLRLAGIAASTEIYANLIRVHGLSGNLTKAAEYLTKRNETPISNTPQNVRPAGQSRPSKNMYAALIEAYAVNGEVLDAWRAYATGWSQYGVSLLNTTDRRFTDAIARHYVDKDLNDIVASLKQVIDTTGILPQNSLAFREHVALVLIDGLIRLASASVSSLSSATTTTNTPLEKANAKFPPIDSQKALSLAQSLLDSLKDPASPLITPQPPTTSSPTKRNAYTTLIGLTKTRINVSQMNLYALTKNVSAASPLLDVAIASKHASRGLVVGYLKTVAGAVESGSISTPEQAVEYTEKGFKALQQVNAETDATVMELLVVISKGNVKQKTGLLGLELGDAISSWVGVGGVPSGKHHPRLSKIVEEGGFKLLI